MIYSEVQNGEFGLDYGILVKTGELVICRLKNEISEQKM